MSSWCGATKSWGNFGIGELMQRGSDLHDRLLDGIGALRDRLEAAERSVEGLLQELGDLEGRRASVLRAIARCHLPELSHDATRETPEGVRADVRAILEEKEARRRALETLIPEERLRVDEAQRVLDEVTAALDEVGARRHRLARAVYDDLKGDERWHGLVAKREKCEARLRASRGRHEAALGERREKCPAYERDPLFSYLARRGYGEADAEGNVLTRRLDRWLAGVMDYEGARERYDLLKQAPEYAAKMLDRAEADLRDVRVPLEALEADVIDRHGLTKVLKRGERLYAERQEGLKGLHEHTETLSRLMEERAALNDSRGRYYEMAIAEIETDLGGRTVEELTALAARTEDPGDDALIRQLADVDGALHELRSGLERSRSERRRMAERLGGLEKMRDRFVAQDWDGRYSRFDDSLAFDALLAGYMVGTHSAGHLNRVLGSSQSFVQPAPAHNSITGFSSGGGFGGGGFSTGGGF